LAMDPEVTMIPAAPDPAEELAATQPANDPASDNARMTHSPSPSSSSSSSSSDGEPDVAPAVEEASEYGLKGHTSVTIVNGEPEVAPAVEEASEHGLKGHASVAVIDAESSPSLEPSYMAPLSSLPEGETASSKQPDTSPTAEAPDEHRDALHSQMQAQMPAAAGQQLYSMKGQQFAGPTEPRGMPDSQAARSQIVRPCVQDIELRSKGDAEPSSEALKAEGASFRASAKKANKEPAIMATMPGTGGLRTFSPPAHRPSAPVSPKSPGEAPPVPQETPLEQQLALHQMLLILLTVASNFTWAAAVVACDANADGECVANEAFAIAVGVTSMVASGVLLVLMYITQKTYLLVVEWFAYFFAAWWIVGVGAGTFSSPFKATGNGYFAEWLGFVVSIYFVAITSRFAKQLEAAQNVASAGAWEQWFAVIAMIFSLIEVIASAVEFTESAGDTESDAGEYGWAIACGLISLGFYGVYVPLHRKCRKDHLPYFGYSMVVWWTAGVGILTFDRPFVDTGNGYFSCWGAFIATACFAITAGGHITWQEVGVAKPPMTVTERLTAIEDLYRYCDKANSSCQGITISDFWVIHKAWNRSKPHGKHSWTKMDNENTFNVLAAPSRGRAENTIGSVNFVDYFYNDEEVTDDAFPVAIQSVKNAVADAAKIGHLLGPGLKPIVEMF